LSTMTISDLIMAAIYGVQPPALHDFTGYTIGAPFARFHAYRKPRTVR